MNEGTDWLPTTCYKPGVGNDTPVKRGLQLGYAKMAGIEQEKLASDLAKLIRVPVPHVEISAVAGHPCAISYVHSPDSYLLAIKGSFVQQAFSPAVNHALKLATGLLSFFAWIGTTDHYDDTNLVVDKLGNGLCRVVAIDFGDAFPLG